jgi:hypothetical protein
MSSQTEIPMEQEPKTTEPSERLRKEMVGGLLYCHSRESTNTSKTLEVTAFAYALIELLIEKGLLTEEELNERKGQVAERLVEKFREAGMGVIRQEPEQDKYKFQGGAKIDCENRIHLCKAACCRLAFALSKQDVEEGIIKWDFGYPYVNARDADGCCEQLERKTCRCAVYENRPVPCRAFDCRKDKRIWLDFENKVVNPDIDEVFKKNGSDEAGRLG